MAAFKRLESHLLALQRLLVTLEGQPCIASVAETQGEVFLASLQGANLTLEQCCALTKVLRESALPDKLRTKLLGAVANQTSAVPSVGGRVRLQNFEAISNYFTTEQWFCFSDLNVATEAKLDLLLDASVHLGLRNPTERTFQMLARLHQLAAQGPDKTRLMSFEQRFAAVQYAKRTLRRKTSSLPAPYKYIPTLPEDPADFQDDCPDIYTAVFGTNNPVRCPIPPATLQACQAAFPMRSTKTVVFFCALGSQRRDGGNIFLFVICCCWCH